MDTNGKSSAETADSPELTETAASAAAPDCAVQLEAALAEKAQLQDLILRRQADFENFRRRTEREKQDIRETASQDAVDILLPIIDDFERALQASPSTGIEEPIYQEYARGIELIHQRLLESLAKLGLQPIAALGQPFDPNLHNAVLREERDDVADQTILDEYQRGYQFKGRLLRPAMVKVAVRP